mmetsp:Transcript_80967/g.251414  ORF Transcript_80967/g.251414 Transcript_80967/m.251414 type:complete len:201 (-) Transcript_80967:151-753(-)
MAPMPGSRRQRTSPLSGCMTATRLLVPPPAKTARPAFWAYAVRTYSPTPASTAKRSWPVSASKAETLPVQPLPQSMIFLSWAWTRLWIESTPVLTGGKTGSPVAGSRNSRQLPAWMVLGRPPAGTKTSAFTRLCMEFRRMTPSSVSRRCSEPWGPSCAASSAAMGSAARKSRRSSACGRPVGSSAQPEPSAMPTMRTLAP